MLQILHIRWQILSILTKSQKWVFQQFLEKNVVFWLWKPQFWNFVKMKKICHPMCKISNNFCLAKYDLRGSWFFDCWAPLWKKCKNQALKKSHQIKLKVFGKSCLKFCKLGDKFFLFWRNLKNEAATAEKRYFDNVYYIHNKSCIFSPGAPKNQNYDEIFL